MYLLKSDKVKITIITFLIIISSGFYSCFKNIKSKDFIPGQHSQIDSVINNEEQTKYNSDSYLDTEFKYTDAAGNDIIIQNSLPKGVGDIDGFWGYTDSEGQFYSYGILWSKVMNNTSSPIKLSIHFPSDLHTAYSDFKLFLPSDTMTEEKVSMYNFGIKGLKSFLDINFNKPTSLEKELLPQEAIQFYVALLSKNIDGVLRTGFFLKEQELFYKISIRPQFDSISFSCGEIEIIKNNNNE